MGKLVFVALLDQGHLNVLYTIGKYILANHPENEIYFVVDEEWDLKVRDECSIFKTLVFKQEGETENSKNYLKKFRESWFLPDEERLAFQAKSEAIYKLWKSRDYIIEKIVDDVKPELVLIDNLINLPFLMKKSYRWGLIISTNPLLVNEDESYPPIQTALPSDIDANKEKREKFYNIIRENKKEVKKKLDDWLIEYGCEPISKTNYLYGSKYINLFNFPEELNYYPLDKMKGRWFQTNSAIISPEINEKLQKLYNIPEEKKYPGLDLLTEEFLAKPGKLILFSLGTIVTKVLSYNKNFMEILAKIPHKFIVSKGQEGNQIILPDNCVGANYLNIRELLQKVDLVIGHGGNNTLTECFYYGVPMIIIPFFGDQFNNAMRIHELEYGIYIDLKTCTLQILEDAINKIISTPSYYDKLKKASKRIQQDKSMDKFCEILVNEFLNKPNLNS